MATTVDIFTNITNFAVGKYPADPVPDFALPVGTSLITADVGTPTSGGNNLAGKAASTTVSIGTEISYDGGATWVSGPQAMRVGGPAFKKDGVTPEDHLGLIGTIPDVNNANRRIRGWMLVVGSTVRLGPCSVTYE